MQCSLTNAEYRGGITSLVLLATKLLIQARMPSAFLATLAHFQLLSTSPQESLPAEQLSSHPCLRLELQEVAVIIPSAGFGT